MKNRGKDNNMTEPLHINLRVLRAAHKLTQGQVAIKIGASRSNYAAYEECRARPPLEIVDRILDLYKITFKELIGVEPIDIIEDTFESRYALAPDNVREAIDLLLKS